MGSHIAAEDGLSSPGRTALLQVGSTDVTCTIGSGC